MPAPLCLPTASISSIKTIAGAFLIACENKSLTRLAPTPTYISTKSEPEIERKGAFASPATAFASNVLPVPGGPTSKTPLGIRAPSSVNLPGSFKNSTISSSSAFSSSQPATSEKVLSSTVFVFTLPKPRVLLVSEFMVSPIFFIISQQSTAPEAIIKTYGKSE